MEMTHPTPHTTPTSAPGALGPARRGALMAFRVLGILTLIAGVIQFALAGLGAFGASFDPHRMLGNLIGIATLVLLVLMLIARPNLRAVLLSVLVAVLAFGVQPVLANVGGDTGASFGGLHALNALAMMGLLSNLTAEAGRTIRHATRPASGSADVVGRLTQ